jgi:hypothetical protein
VVTSVLTWWVLGTGLSTLELVGLALGGVGVLFAATRTRPPRARSAPRGRRRRSEVPV